MAMDKGPDPVTPMIRFDSYVIPETVHEERTHAEQPKKPMPAPQPVAPAPLQVTTFDQTYAEPRMPFQGSGRKVPAMWFAIDPMFAAVGVIGFLTFFTGVLLTLLFSGSDQIAGRNTVPMAAVAPEIAPQPAPVVAPQPTPVAEIQPAPVVVPQPVPAPEPSFQTASTAAAPVVMEDVQIEPPHEDAHLEEPDPPSVPGILSLQGVAAAGLEQDAVLQDVARQDVARQDTGDLITPVGAGTNQEMIPGPDQGASTLSMPEILRGLSHGPNSQETLDVVSDVPDGDRLQALRAAVMAGTYSVEPVTRNGRDRLSLRMPGLELSQEGAAEILREAAQRGEIALPDVLSAADGNFDADTLLFNLVQTSLLNEGTPDGINAAADMSRRAFAASKAKTIKVGNDRVYEVRAGDSLAFISLQFYGWPGQYGKIFEANRKVLNSPDKIQIGQRLIIPG